MKKHWKALAGIVVICLVLSIMSNAMAQDANAAKEIPKETPKETPKEKVKEKKLVIGILKVVKDNDGNVAEITITAHKDLVYNVVLDETSKEMVKSLADARVRVEGFIETKGEVKWLTVDTYSDSKPKPDAKPGAKGKAKPAAKPASKSRK
jgi:hypothetical protein